MLALHSYSHDRKRSSPNKALLFWFCQLETSPVTPSLFS